MKLLKVRYTAKKFQFVLIAAVVASSPVSTRPPSTGPLTLLRHDDLAGDDVSLLVNRKRWRERLLLYDLCRRRPRHREVGQRLANVQTTGTLCALSKSKFIVHVCTCFPRNMRIQDDVKETN